LAGWLVSTGSGATIAWFGNETLNADPNLILLLRDQGHTVDVYNPAVVNVADQAIAAENHDISIISETVVTSQMTRGDGKLSLQDVPRPVLCFEAYLWDNMQCTGGMTIFNDFGVTGRPETPNPFTLLPDAEDHILKHGRDQVYIVNPEHPMAGGFPAGEVKVYTEPFSVGYITNIGEDATVVAMAFYDIYYEPNEPNTPPVITSTLPTIWVYERGDVLPGDGSVAPAPRIGFCWGQGPQLEGNWHMSTIHPHGLVLWEAAVAYTLSYVCPNPGHNFRPGDINQDCYVNLEDLALLAGDWLSCTYWYNPECMYP